MFKQAHSAETRAKISRGLYLRTIEKEGHKRCWRCKELKPVDGFYVARGRVDGRATTCQACSKALSQERTLKRQATPKLRNCRECGIEFLVAGGKSRNQLNCELHRGQKFHRTKRRLLLRAKVYELLGHVCKHCGFDDKRALQIDHVDGGGAQERRKFGSSWENFYKNIEAFPERYQLLCANCNWIKRFENKEANIGDFFITQPKGQDNQQLTTYLN